MPCTTTLHTDYVQDWHAHKTQPLLVHSTQPTLGASAWPHKRGQPTLFGGQKTGVIFVGNNKRHCIGSQRNTGIRPATPTAKKETIQIHKNAHHCCVGQVDTRPCFLGQVLAPSLPQSRSPRDTKHCTHHQTQVSLLPTQKLQHTLGTHARGASAPLPAPTDFICVFPKTFDFEGCSCVHATLFSLTPPPHAPLNLRAL